MTNVLHIRGLVHSYGDVRAVDGVDLTVGAGECVALLGPNGAGKTTIVRNVIGLGRGESGTVSVAGGSPDQAAVRRRLGVVQQDVGFPQALRVGEVLAGAADRSGAERSRIEAVVTEMGLDGLLDRRAGTLSGGQQQRLQLAMGLLADPVLLVLDEPTAGLDVASRRAFWDSISRRRQAGTGVLVTTHIIDEAAAVADRVVVVDRGVVVASGTPDELERTLPNRFVSAATSCSLAMVRALPGVTAAEYVGGRLRVTTLDAEAVVRALLAADAGLRDLTVSTASLEEVLVSMQQEVAA